MEKGRAKKAKQTKEARAKGAMSAKVRWSMLLDGTLTVHDLDDEEVNKMRVRGADGGFSGSRQAMPSHLAVEFHREIVRRAEKELRGNLGKAAELLGKVIDDPEARHSDKIKAAQILFDRVLGKTPETVVLKSDDKFADLLGDAIAEDRDLDDLTTEGL